jgi:Primase C terminal 2 (PriCT-2)/Family of unknown function (DUF5906)
MDYSAFLKKHKNPFIALSAWVEANADLWPQEEPWDRAVASKFTITLFPNKRAQSQRRRDMTLHGLRDKIQNTTALTKARLPWLKLATFGDKRSDKNCLRHNANVLSITGLELDYDAEQMTLDAAVEVAQQVRLAACFYTSARYSDTTPRWRILLPTSKPLPPAERQKLVARVNGVYGGVFSPESFTLSQSYYYGSVNSNPAHCAVVTDGDYVDLRDDLDASAIGKGGKTHDETPTLNAFEQYGQSIHFDRTPPIGEVAAALAAIPNDDKVDRAEWVRVGMALKSATNGSDEGLELFKQWSQSWTGGAYREGYTVQKWKSFKPNKISVGSLYKMANDADQNWRKAYNNAESVKAAKTSEHGAVGVSLSDFYAYMVQHNYIYAPAREMWPASSVNSRCPPIFVGKDAKGEDIYIPASAWLDRNRPVEMLTWAPGMPMIVRDRLISEGGWISRKAVSCFNLYRPPTIKLGDASKAKPWVDLVRKVFPGDADHIIPWFAHRCQRPYEKPNHGLVLGSLQQGIGKDTILEGVKRAVGPWNFKEVLPSDMFEPFNPFVRCVILRVNEAKDMGDVTRFEFYEHMKSYLAAPPDVLPCNEKYIKQHYVLNCMGVIITTNHLTDGIFLPAEDRRHYVAWSDCAPTDFDADFWGTIYRWYDDGGDRHVAAYLATLDISDFDAKAPPPKTAAFWDIVAANRTTEESELQDVLDELGNPDAVTLATIIDKASMDFADWLRERKNRKAIAHRLEACSYRAVTNHDAKDGLWKIGDRRQQVYAKASLPFNVQVKAAENLQREAAEKAEAAQRAAEEKRAKGGPGSRPAKFQ